MFEEEVEVEPGNIILLIFLFLALLGVGTALTLAAAATRGDTLRTGVLNQPPSGIEKTLHIDGAILKTNLARLERFEQPEWVEMGPLAQIIAVERLARSQLLSRSDG